MSSENQKVKIAEITKEIVIAMLAKQSHAFSDDTLSTFVVNHFNKIFDNILTKTQSDA